MKIPNNNNFIQKGDSDTYPITDLSVSQSLDTSEKGILRFSPRLLTNYTSDDDSDLGLPVAFDYFPGVGWFAICGNKIFSNGSNAGVANTTRSPFTTFFEGIDSGLPISNGFDANSDLKYFPDAGKMYATCKGQKTYKFDGSTFSELGSDLTVGGFEKKLCYHRTTARMYQSYSIAKIASWNSSESTATSGQYTLNLGTSANNYITSLVSSPNGIWILTLNLGSEGGSKQFIWDGSQSTGPNDFASLDAAGALAGYIQFNTLFVVTTDGRIMENNGKAFFERARFPFRGKIPKNALLSTMASQTRWIHPNGVTLKNGKVRFVINPEFEDGSDPDERLLAGVWILDPTNNWSLTHELPFTYHAKTSGSVTDYGQLRVSAVGAIVDAEHTGTNNGDLLVGATIFSDATNTRSAIFINDKADTIAKYSSFTTGWIKAQEIKDTFQSVNALISPLLNSTDKIICKYRTKKQTPVIITGTWASTSSFNTPTDLSSYVGWEVQVLNGTGGAKAAHIVSVTNNGGSGWLTVIDDTFSGVSSGTFKARVSNFTKCAAEFSNQIEDAPNFPFLNSKASTKFQLKFCFQLSGNNELHNLILNRTKHQ